MASVVEAEPSLLIASAFTRDPRKWLKPATDLFAVSRSALRAMNGVKS